MNLLKIRHRRSGKYLTIQDDVNQCDFSSLIAEMNSLITKIDTLSATIGA